MQAPSFLQTPLQFLKGVGPRRATDLERAGLVTIEDLLYRLPLRYEDRGTVRRIADLVVDERACVIGEVLGGAVRRTRRPGFTIFELALSDASGATRVTWLNQPFLKDLFQPRQRLMLFGKVERRRGGGLHLVNPEYELLGDDDHDGDAATETGRIVPVYERAGSVTPKMFRRIVSGALERLPAALDDPLPVEVRARRGLPERRVALAQAHVPDVSTSVDRLNAFRAPAQVRLIFEEFFAFQLGLLRRRREIDSERKPVVPRVDDRVRRAALDVLPFRLTASQKRAVKEIVDDMQRPAPMNRLLQGDVGAGKTIVALLAALVAMESGLQVAFMAPTEILAEQHFASLRRLLQPSRFEVVLLTGGMSAAQRQAAQAALKGGAAQLAVGTHALVQEPVDFQALGLVVIDEQHRFGVLQRASLRGKGLHPDVLVMTATPIPRTLALTAYGDLDVSVITERPPGRQPVRTITRPPSGRAEAYRLVARELAAGHQAYVVYPLVEQSEKTELKAATAMAAELTAVFPAHRIGLVHGRLKREAKDEVMEAFARGDVHILVSTTVIEVGVDVANATVMIVEDAERFGLAQLHQLRGRVGRSAARSHCVLLHGARLSDLARQRLRTLATTDDGFEIAERDLELRGPGEFFGTRQSGMPTFRVGDLVRDHRLMEEARREAVAWLRARPEDAWSSTTRQLWARRFGLIEVG